MEAYFFVSLPPPHHTNVRGRVFGSRGKAGCGAGAGWRFGYKVLPVRRWKNWLMRPITAFSYPDLTHALKSLVSRMYSFHASITPSRADLHAHMRRKKKYSQFQLVALMKCWQGCVCGNIRMNVCRVSHCSDAWLYLSWVRDCIWGQCRTCHGAK